MVTFLTPIPVEFTCRPLPALALGRIDFRSIFKYNFRKPLREYYNPCRVYCLNGIDYAIQLLGGSQKELENLAQYIARPPISLKKIILESSHGKVLYHTSYNEYFKENLKIFDTTDFIALLTLHIPPKGIHLIRRYGLYSSRSRGKWIDKPYVVRLAPDGWKEKLTCFSEAENMQAEDEADRFVFSAESRASWARLIAKIYETDPMVCQKCAFPMKIIAVITDPEEVKKILRHLVKTGKSPPGLDPASLN